MKLTNIIRITATIMLAVMPICTIAINDNYNQTAQKVETKNTVAAYRICVFSGTEQNARTEANSALLSINKNFEGMPANLIYNAPIWKVHVGQCLNKTEATILLQRIRETFPTAYIVSERINIGEFTQTPSFALPNKKPIDDSTAL